MNIEDKIESLRKQVQSQLHDEYQKIQQMEKMERERTLIEKYAMTAEDIRSNAQRKIRYILKQHQTAKPGQNINNKQKLIDDTVSNLKPTSVHDQLIMRQQQLIIEKQKLQEQINLPNDKLYELLMIQTTQQSSVKQNIEDRKTMEVKDYNGCANADVDKAIRFTINFCITNAIEMSQKKK